ncbi:alpha-2-macroglobulin family protein [Mucilaginibacter sp.]|jgi:uncharacterized protein YfaS (alpha-2-macroglobulin family)|uniref:alpha-2-macroglobulin family protein n=1 Tax=Mucilaginibacter sp. TaxID=1882438 RepID=UPI0035677AA9
MPLQLLPIQKYFLIICLSLIIQPAFAQDYQGIIYKIDSLAAVGLPKSAIKEVDKLDAFARKNNNVPQQVRAAIYRMTFQSYTEESALAAIITRLQQDIEQAKFPVKPVLQSLLADTYWKYYQQHRYNFVNRTRLTKPDADFTKWDLQTIVTETSRLYRLSLSEYKMEQNTPISLLDGVLLGDKTTRYLRPTLYDMLVQRALDFYLSEEPALLKPRSPFILNDAALFGDSKTFAGLTITTTDTASTWYTGIKYLQQATAFHLQNNEQEAAADLDLQRLQFLFSKASVQNQDSLYLSALRQIAVNYSAKPISSEAVMLQGVYYQTRDSLNTARLYYKKAALAYPESLGGKNANAFIGQIESKSLSATVEKTNVPGKPLLALISYKNITAASIILYRLSIAQSIKYTNGKDATRADILKKLTPVQSHQYQLPQVSDYRNHTTEVKLDALPPGNYILKIKDAASDAKTLTGVNEFRLSNLAYSARTTPDNKTELLVMNRETGAHLSGVQVILAGKYFGYKDSARVKSWIDIVEKSTTGKEGIFATNRPVSNNVSITLRIKGDTLIDESKYIVGASGSSADDNDTTDKTVLFTDRQIYRPGQIIYFKGLQLQTFGSKSRIMPGMDAEIKFNDVNGKEVSKLKLKTNEYGTFAGSFVIPQTMLGGAVELETDDGSVSVQVEEYKRPTFQAEFLPVKDSYKPNDSVTVKGAVTAFSGYGLSQARVAYRIVRTENLVYADQTGEQMYRYIQPVITEIKSDTIITDDQGKFNVKFRAVTGAKTTGVNSYNYAITADITDASGETRSAQTSITIGKNNIVINADVPNRLFAKDTMRSAIRVNNLNGQSQKADVKVAIYALQNPDKVFKARLWPIPDQFSISKEEFKKDFTEYAHAKEDMFATWVTIKQVINLNLSVDEEKPGIVDLKNLRNQLPGVYRMVISARNAMGDTTSITRYVDLIAQPGKPSSINNWVVPVINNVKPGQSAEFLVGIDQNVAVLMEHYNGTKLISSKWVTIEKGQQSIKVPVAAGDKHPAVQFLMMYQNRLYNSYQKINVINPDKSLKLKFLTFRDKLQPGEKEQWKLQISDYKNEKQSAELLAGLYDASLNDLAPAANWEQAIGGNAVYQPNYFMWNYFDFNQASITNPLAYNNLYYTRQTRDYEKLNLFGYDYYGGYNVGYHNYLAKAKQNLLYAENDKLIEANYQKNAALIKTGYDVTGKVLGAEDAIALPGVMVTIKGRGIGTMTNSKGFFKIKVPVNGVLIFTYLGYNAKEYATSKRENIAIRLTANNQMLNEVVVVSYVAQQKKALGFASTSMVLREIRTKSSVRVNGKDFESSAADMSFVSGRVPGVQIHLRGQSTLSERKGSVHSPKPISIRTNFNETAFFYPQLHTDSKGQILIEFTIPEALTKWKFRALAHTKELQTGYTEEDVVTQKQLSISANTPRFLREGDTLTISARLANLTAGQLKGKVNMQLFNALNMQPVTLLQHPADAMQNFEIAESTNKAVSFKIIIPQGLDALTYRLTAEAGQYSDGEENTIPVLPNRMLVTEAMPMMVRAGQTRAFTFDKLLNNKSTTLKSKTLTLEYTQNPAWYAVQAIPYMMEFPYECSEQIFSRYYANTMATKLVNSMPVIKQVFDQWKMGNSQSLLSNLEKNQELKATLLEETPWLRDAVNETDQKKRIALLFDLNKMSNELQLNLDKLQTRQLPDGGFPWFAGDRSDRYITQHILAGIGQLYHSGTADDKSAVLKSISTSAIKYLDAQIIKDEESAKKAKNYETRDNTATEIHAWYTRSYFTNKPMSPALKAVFNNYLKRAEKQWLFQGVYEQGMIALTMQRSGKAAIAKAIIKSLMETAQQNDEMGMYWAKNQRGYYWYQSPVETQSLLIELMTEAGNNNKAVEDMKIWLLRNKQTNNWKTTKATAAACYALLLKQGDWLSASNTSEIKLDGTLLTQLKPDITADAGTGYLKTSWVDDQIKPALSKVAITNNGKSISWGAMYWQYLEQLDKITPSQTDIHLERKYFIMKQTNAGPVATAVDATHQPKTGDLLKVIVYLKAGRDFEYVQLKDMRPAGTEPVTALSEYKYQDGLYYYQVTKDAATNFFISNLNKGNYVFEYQLRVAQPGNFSTGVATVQCMYAPEFNAHSDGLRIDFKP